MIAQPYLKLEKIVSRPAGPDNFTSAFSLRFDDLIGQRKKVVKKPAFAQREFRGLSLVEYLWRGEVA